MSTILPHLHACLDRLKSAERVWLGYSGGLDSTVLLHQLAALKLADLRAIHINHNLSPHSGHWQAHCQQTADALGVPLVVESVSVSADGQGLEAAARSSRYRAFEKALQPGDLLLLAHHANDQAETFFYRLMRGSGLKGLSGVPASRPIGRRARLLRPLLNVTREELLEVAQAQKLDWVEDESNFDTAYDRNYIRHKLLPVLEGRWQHAVAQVAGSASLLADSHQLLDAYLEDDLQACKLRKERLGASITLNVFLNFSEIRQQHVLRYWMAGQGMTMPSQAQLQEIDKLINAAADAQPEVSWGEQKQGLSGGSVYRYQNRLYLTPRLNLALDREATYQKWDGSSPLKLGNFTLSGKQADFGLAPGNYRILFREGGERCKPAERERSQTLKKLLQEYRLEPWLRDAVPLIFRGEKLAAVGDLWICQGFVVEQGYKPLWRIE